jgi:hypothetical protein
MNDRMANLKKMLTERIGVPIEITIRGERKFTFSTDQVTPDLEARLAEFFGQTMTLTSEHDDEVGSFVYAEAI